MIVSISYQKLIAISVRAARVDKQLAYYTGQSDNQMNESINGWTVELALRIRQVMQKSNRKLERKGIN